MQKIFVILIVVLAVVVVLALALGLGLGLGLRKNNSASVNNIDNCNLAHNVVLYFATPGTVLANLTSPVTIYASGLSQPTQGIYLFLEADTSQRYSLTQNNTGLNQLLVFIIANTVPPGVYGIGVTDPAGGCDGILHNATTIVSPTDAAALLSLTSVTPNYLYKGCDG